MQRCDIDPIHFHIAKLNDKKCLELYIKPIHLDSGKYLISGTKYLYILCDFGISHQRQRRSFSNFPNPILFQVISAEQKNF